MFWSSVNTVAPPWGQLRQEPDLLCFKLFNGNLFLLYKKTWSASTLCSEQVLSKSLQGAMHLVVAAAAASCPASSRQPFCPPSPVTRPSFIYYGEVVIHESAGQLKENQSCDTFSPAPYSSGSSYRRTRPQQRRQQSPARLYACTPPDNCDKLGFLN